MNKLLNDAERKDLRNYERTIRNDASNPRSYLVGFEICRRYGLKPEPLQESQMMAMDKLYYKYQDMIEKAHNDNHAVAESGVDGVDVPDCPCPTDLEALYAWEDYAMDQMTDSIDWKMALTVVLLTLTLR